MLNGHALHASARELSGLLAPIEASFDETIMLQADFLARAPAARLKANLPVSVGHEAMVHIAAAITATVQARGRFIEAHRELVGVRDGLRLPVTAEGTGDGCPSNHPVSAQLRIVETNAA